MQFELFVYVQCLYGNFLFFSRIIQFKCAIFDFTVRKRICLFIHLSYISIYRVTLTSKQTKWADIVVPIGGDGTFLLTASRACPLLANDKPIVGFNSDPERSEGRLLLPAQYSYAPNEAVRKLTQVNAKSYCFAYMHIAQSHRK